MKMCQNVTSYNFRVHFILKETVNVKNQFPDMEKTKRQLSVI